MVIKTFIQTNGISSPNSYDILLSCWLETLRMFSRYEYIDLRSVIDISVLAGIYSNITIHSDSYSHNVIDRSVRIGPD